MNTTATTLEASVFDALLTGNFTKMQLTKFLWAISVTMAVATPLVLPRGLDSKTIEQQLEEDPECCGGYVSVGPCGCANTNDVSNDFDFVSL